MPAWTDTTESVDAERRISVELCNGLGQSAIAETSIRVLLQASPEPETACAAWASKPQVLICSVSMTGPKRVTSQFELTQIWFTTREL